MLNICNRVAGFSFSATVDTTPHKSVRGITGCTFEEVSSQVPHWLSYIKGCRVKLACRLQSSPCWSSLPHLDAKYVLPILSLAAIFHGGINQLGFVRASGYVWISHPFPQKA